MSEGEASAALWDTANEIATEAIECFSRLRPQIRMNSGEWAILREVIEREVVGHFSSAPVSATDLLNDPLYKETAQ